MLSFRIEDEEVARATAWAERLGVDRSQLLRDALRRHLDHLGALEEAAAWVDDEEHERAVAALAGAAEWGPVEDWSDWSEWADAAG